MLIGETHALPAPDLSYGSSIGGYSAGQRYLVPILSFLALPLAVAFRRFPATTTALALVSIIIAVTTTATHVLAGYQLDWFDRVASRDFTFTVARFVGVTGWPTILPFFIAGLVTVAAAALDTRWLDPRGPEIAFAGVGVLGWAIVAATSPKSPLLGGNADSIAAYDGVMLALFVVTLAACATWWATTRRSPRSLSS